MNEKLTEQVAGGMTVNERLFTAGLMDSFDQAVARKDDMELRNILNAPPKDADAIINQLVRLEGGTA